MQAHEGRRGAESVTRGGAGLGGQRPKRGQHKNNQRPAGGLGPKTWGQNDGAHPHGNKVRKGSPPPVQPTLDRLSLAVTGMSVSH